MRKQSDHAVSVAISANHAAYLRARQTGSVGACWDLLILTAANERQANGYRAELALRHRDVGTAGAFFPPIQQSLVIADPPGRRIGSGGATLRAIREASRQLNLSIEELCRLRVLLIHSGGASQRLPAYSPQGKIFSPIAMQRPDAQIATLFDHLYITLAGLPERLGPGILTVAGDVLLVFDHRHVTTPAKGVTALTMRAPAELGKSHGVFVTDTRKRVRTTLQKASIEQMQIHKATDSNGQVLLDTGLLFFDASATNALAVLAGLRGKGLDERTDQQIDLYDEMAGAMATSTQQSPFLRAGPKIIRTALWKALRPIAFHAMTLQGHFLHLGTTRQFRDTLTGRENAVAAELFGQNVLARIDWSVDQSARVFASVLLDRRGKVGRGAVIEHSILRGDITIGDDSVVSQVESSTPFTLPDRTLLFQAPVRTNRGQAATVQVVCGVLDDFKGLYRDGKSIYLNERIELFFKRHAITAADIWKGVPADKRTLWTARLFPATSSRDAVDQVLWLAGSTPATNKQLATWKKSSRYSMAMILEAVDAAALIAHREVVTANLQTLDLLARIDRDEDVSPETVISHYVSANAYEAVKSQIMRYASASIQDATHPFRQAKALWALATLGKRPDRMLASDRSSAEASAFAKIAEATENATPDTVRIATARNTRIKAGQKIEARSPVRIDLAGGWSDTPPHCFERGGAVVNLAIDLDDGPPIRATVTTTTQKKLVFHSVDLGRRTEITHWNPMVAPDLIDPLAMHKVAMRLVGLCPDVNEPVAKWLNRTGCGIEVQTECRVPKGSGLGTSSILAATLLAALCRLKNVERTHEQLINDTLILEQRLGTGGGWQDQAGGIVGGIKLTTSEAGVPQIPVVRRLKLSSADLNELESRLVVCFSGQQRLARDILRRVMGRWLGREPAMIGLMNDLIGNAHTLAGALESGRWNVVGREIARYWQIKKDLYPASTTPSVDVLLRECAGLSVACGLAGAGGGGFGYFFCRDAKQAAKLRDYLADRLIAPGMMGSVYQTKINRKGLVLDVK